ncbi:hypothetical protein T4C_1169, partial [Trichinella pseudospiralis]
LKMDSDDNILSQIQVSLCCVKLTPSYNDIRRVDVLISNPTLWKIAYKIHTTRKDMLYIKPSYAFIGKWIVLLGISLPNNHDVNGSNLLAACKIYATLNENVVVLL